MKKNSIIEVYPAVQSEGSRAGMPTIVVRTTGCTHRCYFGEGGWCDTWYTSIHPEKAQLNLTDVLGAYVENPQISEMMITGGSPTMHPELISKLTEIANEAFQRKIFTTMETEGSHFIETTYPIDLVSFSPKFSNSVPVVGVRTPGGKTVDQRFVDTHNRLRLNKEAIRKTINYHADYHFKPVWDGTEENLQEIEAFRVEMNIPKNKTWIMPGGDTGEELNKVYGPTMEMCTREGYNFTSRVHINAWGAERMR